VALEESSAGIVVFRAQPRREYLLLDYGRHWDYPKGHIEADESPRAAAIRELKEETGIADAKLINGFAEKIVYFFRVKKTGLVRKTVIFFLAQTQATQVQISDEHVGFEFLPFDDALRRLTYASARQVLRRAEEYLGLHAPPGDNAPA
jgi:8-oxo-dGTP pyrophosphatase MutT (NUDIX family)